MQSTQLGFKDYCCELMLDLLARSHFLFEKKEGLVFAVETHKSGPLVIRFHNEGTECATTPSPEIRIGYFDLVSLYSILLSIWGNPDFFPNVGEVYEMPKIDNQTPVPIGFEIEEQIFAMEESSELRVEDIKIGDWAIQTESCLKGIRKYALNCSFSSGLASLVLHEIAHLELGHAIQGLRHSALTGRNRLPRFPYLGCEISADRSSAQRTIQDQVVSSNGKTLSAMRQICLFSGMIATYLRVHGAIDLRNLSAGERDRTHPPVWFRCYDLHLISKSRPEINSDNLNGTLGELSKLHPMIGSLLHPIRDNEVATHHADLQKTALNDMESFDDVFNRNMIRVIRS